MWFKFIFILWRYYPANHIYLYQSWDIFRLKFKNKLILNNQISKWERKKPSQKPTRKPEEEELKPSPSTSTKCWSKCTQTSESPRKPWTSWTPSFMTPSTESPLKAPNSSASTREGPSPPEKFNRQSSWSCQENWPDTPFLKEPRQLPNTSSNDFCLNLICLIK